MAEKGKKQSSKKKKRGVNVRVVQKNKTSSRENIRVNNHQKKAKNTTKKSTPKKATKKAPVILLPKETKVEEKKVKEASFDEFETMKITRAEAPRESKIITRDVEKETILKPEPIAQEKETTKKVPEQPAVHQEPIKRQKSIVYQKPTAKEIKEREIKKALNIAAKLPETDNKHERKKSLKRTNFTWTRVVLATACVATTIFAAIYFINLTSTDMSLKVAAMQSGIEASYPSYVPRGYTLSDVTSASGKVTMHFKSGDDGFTITEESSNWDSNALLNNYVKESYDNEYTVVREQGLTLYMGDDWEAWVNGGMLYRLFVNSGTLTKKQMKTIAASL